MDRSLTMKMVIVGFAVAVMMQWAAAQTTYVVGGSLGWDIPQNGAVAYSNWASTNQFMLGDILTFNFRTNQHDVQQVSRESFNGCNSANPIGRAITTGPANITLTSAGENYFICTFGSHCQQGQRLAITVSAAPGAAIPPSTATPGAPFPTSNTPPDAACAPAGGPTPGTGTGGITPPLSSSPAMFASLFLPFMSAAAAAALFF